MKLEVRKHYTGGKCAVCDRANSESVITRVRDVDTAICFACLTELNKTKNRASQPPQKKKSKVHNGKDA